MEKINKFMNDSQTYDEFNNDIDKKLKEEDFLGALKICGEAQKIFPDKFLTSNPSTFLQIKQY